MPKVVCIRFEGGFGNNLFQYAMGRALADTWKAELQTPDWVGQVIFEDAGSAKVSYASNNAKEYRTISSLDINDDVVILNGFWQNRQSLSYYSREQVNRWFKLKPEFQIDCKVMDIKPYLAYHIRKGDMASNTREWATISHKSYLSAFVKYNCTDMLRVEVNQDNPHINDKIVPPHLRYLVDWQIMMNSDVLFRANSSFSWWASALGKATTFSPRVNGLYGHVDANFERGNHCPFTSGIDSLEVDW